MCFIAGSFGVEQLCAHTIAYNLIPLLFMIPLGTSTGLSVRMGTVLAIDPKKAAMLARWTMGIIATLGAILGIALFWNQLRVIAMFTADPVVVDLCQQIWGYTSYYVFMLYIFGINSAILRGECGQSTRFPVGSRLTMSFRRKHLDCNGAWQLPSSLIYGACFSQQSF